MKNIFWVIKVRQEDGIVLEHRIMYEKGEFFGTENLTHQFSDRSAVAAFFNRLLQTPEGIVGNISWCKE